VQVWILINLETDVIVNIEEQFQITTI